MDLDDIKKMDRLIAILDKVAFTWKASFHISLESGLVIQDVDTSSTQITVTKLFIRYRIVQDKIAMKAIPIPPMLLDHYIPARGDVIEFHICALKLMLLDYAPTKLDWADAYEDARKNHEL